MKNLFGKLALCLHFGRMFVLGRSRDIVDYSSVIVNYIVITFEGLHLGESFSS